MKKAAIIGTISILSVFFASTALAQQMRHGGMDDDKPRQGMMMQKDGGMGMMGQMNPMCPRMMGGGMGMGQMCPMCARMMGGGMGRMGGGKGMMGGMGMMGPMHGEMHQMGMGLMRGAGPSFYLDRKENLDLTVEQIQQLRQIRRDFRKDFIRQSADMKIAMIDLKEGFLGDWSVEEAEKQLRSLSQLRTDLLVRYLQARKAAEEVLTPEQLQKVRDESAGEDSEEDLFQDD